MKRLILTLLMGTSLFLGTNVDAQTKADTKALTPVDVTAYVGFATPRRGFADVATDGFDVGVKARFPIERHLSIVGSIDLFTNNFANGSHLYKIGHSDFSAISYDGKPTFYNLPIMAQLRFGSSSSKIKNLDFWMEGAVGINCRMISPERWTLTTVPNPVSSYVGSCSAVTDFDTKFTLASQWGLGITLLSRYSVGLVWYNLGRSSVTGSTTIVSGVLGSPDGNTVYREGSVIPFTGEKLRPRIRAFRFGLTF